MAQNPALVSRWRPLVGQLMPPPGGRIAARLQRLRSRLWIYALLVFAWGIYIYFMSAGGLKNWPVYGDFLDLQADGFRAGHLYLPLTPARELLQAQDPYDRINIRYWPLDVSLYHGKYFIYWGPVPSLLQALGKTLLDIHRGIGDQCVGLFSACLAGMAGALIVERMGRRLFPTISRPLLGLGMLAFAFANPLLHLVTTAGTYQVAILSGQTWLLVGTLAAFDAVWHSGTVSARRWRHLLAGIGWGFAIASRVTLLPGVAVLIGITALADGWVSQRRWLSSFSSALWLGLPVAAIGIALLVYNQLRFDDWREFGLNVQLSGYPKIEFSARHALANLYSYSLRPFVTSCQFPYFYQVWKTNPDAFPKGFPLPSGYMIDEPVIGWARAIPLTWLSPFAFLLVPRPFDLRQRQTRVYLWCVVAFSTMASLTGLTALGIYGATMRYLGDITPGLVLLALFAGFSLRAHYFGRIAPRITTGAITGLSLATIVMGMLIGYQGYNGHFHVHNPHLDAQFVKTLSFCGGKQVTLPRFTP